MIKLRRATKQDIPEVARLANIIWNEYYTPVIGAEQVAYMINSLQNEQAMLSQLEEGMHYFLVLNKNDEPCGYVGYKIEENDTIFLSKVYILKEMRGNGLLNLVLEHFKELSAKKVHLTVNKYNYDSIAAYEKKGFVKASDVVFDIGGGYIMDDYIMEKHF